MTRYGSHFIDPKCPKISHLAASLVLNSEEGGETCILGGNFASEAHL